MPAFEVTTSRVGDRLVVGLAGELDMGTIARVSAEVDPLLAAGLPAVLVFDLAALSFVDSSGLALFVGYRNDGRADGFGVALRHVDERTRRVLEMTHLADVFDVEDPEQAP